LSPRSRRFMSSSILKRARQSRTLVSNC